MAVTMKRYVTGKMVSAAVWNNELVPPLSKRELKLECALTEIVSRGLETHLDYMTLSHLFHRRIVNGQWAKDGITAKP